MTNDNSAHGYTEGSEPIGPKVTFHKEEGPRGKPYAKADFTNVPPIGMKQDNSARINWPGKWKIIDVGHTNELIEERGEGVQYVAAYIKFTGDERKQKETMDWLSSRLQPEDKTEHIVEAMKDMADRYGKQPQTDTADEKYKEAFDYAVELQDREFAAHETITRLKAELEKLKYDYATTDLCRNNLVQACDALKAEIEILESKLKLADRNAELLRGHRDELESMNQKLREALEKVIASVWVGTKELYEAITNAVEVLDKIKQP
jgi:chromosome segregation ATPase